MPKRALPDVDARGAKPGEQGQPAHVRNEAAAAGVVRMVGYGMSQPEIAACLCEMFGGGFSKDTLDRHYRAELDKGLALQKEKLLERKHKLAMMADIPEGVSKDAAFKIANDSTDWLLNTVHKMRPGHENDLTGSINVTISKEDAEL